MPLAGKTSKEHWVVSPQHVRRTPSQFLVCPAACITQGSRGAWLPSLLWKVGWRQASAHSWRYPAGQPTVNGGERTGRCGGELFSLLRLRDPRQGRRKMMVMAGFLLIGLLKQLDRCFYKDLNE